MISTAEGVIPCKPEQYKVLRKYVEYRVKSAFSNLSDEEIEDVVSEAIVWLLNHISQQPIEEIRDIRLYVTSLAINTAKHAIRQKRTLAMHTTDLIQSILNSEREYTDNTAKAFAHSLIEVARALPKPEAQVFVLYYFEQLTHEEIADALGITEGCSKKRLQRARQKVRQHPCTRDYLSEDR